MKAFLWWFAVCAVLGGLAYALRSLPDDWKGIAIAVIFVLLNVRLVWGLERR